MNINATGTFDREKGTLTIAMDPAATSEMEHEILAVFLAEPRKVTMLPAHFGDELHFSIVIDDDEAFDQAVHNLENRKRAQDGRPSLEEEAARAAAQLANVAQAEADAKAAADAQTKAQKESQDRIERLAAESIADRTLNAKLPAASAPAPTAETPASAPEPKKVQ